MNDLIFNLKITFKYPKDDYIYRMKSTLTLLFAFLYATLFAQVQLPANMYADTLAHPFLYGVASGDPSASGVILWTKVEVDLTQINPIPLNYLLATDAEMNNIVQTGTTQATILTDWTAKIDVTNLESATTYYYQFELSDGTASQIGRTKTAPSGASDELNFAIASCSSIYSGYFNAYRRIAERDELDLVIHVGDYVYDFVDEDERIRVPEPPPIDPLFLDEWRALHTYYLLDPDLRLMRQMHPIAVIWDNHDTDGNDAQTTMEAMQAFHEYLPVRQQAEDLHLYRRLQYGDLVDIIFMDAELYRDQDFITPEERSVLGFEQYDWLINEIDNSTAQWRIFGTQKMFGLWNIQNSPIDLPIGNGEVVDPNSWDGYMLEREMLLTHLRDNEKDNNIFVTGDLHFALALDIPIHPLDPAQYNPQTGEGSVGVEMMGGSITRGNLDESGYDPFIADILTQISFSLNPHHIYEELVKHGYGTLTIRPDTTIGRFWFSDILQFADGEELGEELFCINGKNHWERFATVSTQTTANEDFYIGNPFPNPANEELNINISIKKPQQISVQLFDIEGRAVREVEFFDIHSNDTNTLTLSSKNMETGIYMIRIAGKQFEITKKIIIMN